MKVCSVIITITTTFLKIIILITSQSVGYVIHKFKKLTIKRTRVEGGGDGKWFLLPAPWNSCNPMLQTSTKESLKCSDFLPPP